jgi:hypothetical protein
MKKLLVFAMALTLFNCQDDLNENGDNLEQQTLDPAILNKIEALGFDTTSTPVYTVGDDYIVENDIALTKEVVFGDITEKQRKSRNILSCGNRMNIRVRNRLSGVHSTALVTAVSNWNSNSNNLVSFTIVTNNQDINVRFATEADGLRSSTAATARTPNGRGRAGALVRVNRSFTIRNRPWSTILTHELGHAIGFAHTNSSSGSFITGSQREDSDSVMNSGGTTGCCISNGDREALTILYGSCRN